MWMPTSQDSGILSSVLSQTGYAIIFSGFPILSKSVLQTEISLSTCEAEYIALSTAMREIIPMKRVLKEITKIMNCKLKETRTFSTIFEDNNGALELAKVPKMRPRTKHIAIKYHHFREHVKNKTVKVVHVDTNEQLADILTKPLSPVKFERLRKKLMGW